MTTTTSNIPQLLDINGHLHLNADGAAFIEEPAQVEEEDAPAPATFAHPVNPTWEQWLDAHKDSFMSESELKRAYEEYLSDNPAPRTIDLTPTWGAVIHILLAALEDGTEEGKHAARTELVRLAGLADSIPALLAMVSNLDEYLREIRAENLDGSEPALGDSRFPSVPNTTNNPVTPHPTTKESHHVQINR